MVAAVLGAMRPPHPYILSSILVSFGGLLFGLDTGCIGPVTTMSQFRRSFGAFSSTVHGVVVSSILVPAALTSFFAGSVADRVGRVLAISSGAAVFAVGAALEAAAQSLAMLVVGRCVAGVGEGLFLSTLVVYVVEISPAAERGVLASVPQLLVSVGICAGYFVCYGTVRAAGSSLSWRLPFALQSFLALLYGAAVFLLLPPSPRWLKSKGRLEEAREAWDRLGVADAEREKEVEQQRQQQPGSSRQHHGVPERTNSKVVEPESLVMAPTRSHQSFPGDKAGSWLRIFRADVRSRTLLAAFMMGMQQLSGIDGVLYYAPLLFQQAGLSSRTASFLASGISALLMMLVTIPAFLCADKWGRRTSTLAGGIALGTSMTIIGALYAASAVDAHGPARWIVVVLVYVFALTFSVTWALHVRVYASEIQPLATRAPATSFAQTANWAVNFLVALTTPVLLARSSSAVYFLFGGASFLTVVVCAVGMPETRNKSLEEIEEAFRQRERRPRRALKEVLGEWAWRVRWRGFVSSRAGLEEHEL